MNKKTENNLICKNTYYQIPIELMAIGMASIKKNSKYALSKTDIKNNWYLVIKYLNIPFKIPFKALFHTNSKIKGIHGFDFNNASFCDSFRLGLCHIPVKKFCYAYVFELQYIKSKTDKKGFLKLNAYYKGLLMIRVLKILYSDNSLKSRLFDYINLKIKVLRFNVNSDFKDKKDYKFILELASNCYNTVIYGYTARDDLLTDYDSLEYSNLTINGSNVCYDNKYYATFSIEYYFKSHYKCLGDCLECKKCFKLKNKDIVTLFHNSNSDSILNTLENRQFLIELLANYGLILKETDLKRFKGIFKSLNQYLIETRQLNLIDFEIKNIKSLLDFLSKNNMFKTILEVYKPIQRL